VPYSLTDLGADLYRNHYEDFHAHASIECDGTTTAAAEYLSLIAFPYQKPERDRFIRAAEWLSIKANSKITKKEAKAFIQTLPPYNFRNAEQVFDRGILNIAKATKAWHSHKVSIGKNQSLAKSHEEIAEAYALDERAKNSYYDCYDRNNFNNDIYSPYCGVLHLIEGFNNSFLLKLPISQRHLKPAILHPFWVNDAINIAHNYLMAQLTENFLKLEKKIDAKSSSELHISKVITVGNGKL